MSPVVIIKNPVINSPFEEPKQHFKFDELGITEEIEEGRRPSQYFIPIPAPKKKGEWRQGAFDMGWTIDQVCKQGI